MYGEYKAKCADSSAADVPFEVFYKQELNEKFACQHLNKKHCAKFMCQSCYHQRGNTRMAHLCEHKNKPNYSKGKCKNCYLNQYYLKRLKKKREIKKKQ